MVNTINGGVEIRISFFKVDRNSALQFRSAIYDWLICCLKTSAMAPEISEIGEPTTLSANIKNPEVAKPNIVLIRMTGN